MIPVPSASSWLSQSLSKGETWRAASSALEILKAAVRPDEVCNTMGTGNPDFVFGQTVQG